MRSASRLAPTESGTDPGADPFALVERDHREVDQLFARAAALSGPPRRAVIEALVAALTTHAELEETVVYPALSDVLGATTDLVSSAEDDHAEITALLRELAGASTDDELTARLGALQRKVLEHVTVEEGVVFPSYRRLAPPSARKKLMSAVRSAKKTAAPSGPAATRSAGTTPKTRTSPKAGTTTKAGTARTTTTRGAA